LKKCTDLVTFAPPPAPPAPLCVPPYQASALSAQAAANIFAAYAGARCVPGDEEFTALLSVVQERADEYDLQSVVSTLVSLSKLQAVPQFERAEAAFRRRYLGPHLMPNQVHHLMAAFCRAEVDPVEDAWSRLVAAAADFSGGMRAQELSMTFGALADMARPAPATHVAQLLSVVRSRAAEFERNQVFGFIWALSVLACLVQPTLQDEPLWAEAMNELFDAVTATASNYHAVSADEWLQFGEALLLLRRATPRAAALLRIPQVHQACAFSEMMQGGRTPRANKMQQEVLGVLAAMGKPLQQGVPSR
jgi:hypothetical protein